MPPVVTIISPFENQQVEIAVEPLPTVQYTCEDDVAVDTCDASIGSVGGPNPPITVGNGMPLDILAPGQYVLSVRSTDTSGNANASSVIFEMVGGQQADETAPTIDILVPVDGAQVKKGAVLHANYSCHDLLSGLDSCEGPMPSGNRVDTSTVGVKDFTVVARDKAGNESTKTVQYEVIPAASVTISGTVRDTSGQLLPGSTVQAFLAGTTDVIAETDANSEGVYSLTLSEGTYDLRYRGPEGSGIGANLKNRTLIQDEEINVTMGPVGITLSGVFGDGSGLSYSNVYVYDANWAQVGITNAAPDGTWSVEVLPGSYRVNAYYSTTSGVSASTNYEPRMFTADTTVAAHPSSVPVTVNLLGSDGQPAAGRARVECNLYYPDQGSLSYNSTRAGTGAILTSGLPTPGGQTCAVSVDPDDGPIVTRRIEIPEDGTSVDVTVEPGITLSGVFGDGSGLSYSNVYVYDANWAQVGITNAAPDGTWSVEVLPGSYRVNAYYSTTSGVSASTNYEPRMFTADTTVDAHPSSVPVTVNLLGSDGQPAAGRARVECNLYYPDQGSLSYNSTRAGTGAILTSGLPTPGGQTCAVSVDPDDGPIVTRRIEIPEDGTSVDVTVEPGITLSGVLGDGSGLSYSNVYVYDANWAQVGITNAAPDGTWSVEVLPGSYRVNAYYSTTSGVSASTNYEPRMFTADTTVAAHPSSVPVTVNLLGSDGQPAAGRARVECNLYYPDQGSLSYNSTRAGTGAILTSGLPTPGGQTCAVSVDPDDGPIVTRRIEIPEDGLELTILTFGAGIVIDGDTDTTNDGDNVADAVEALAPNNGDGNNDGTPDYEQQNVTSLPVNGGGLGEGESYVTVAAPAGTGADGTSSPSTPRTRPRLTRLHLQVSRCRRA